MQKMLALWADVESTCLLCWTAERDLTLENFEKACKAIVRMQESAATGELEQALALEAVPGISKLSAVCIINYYITSLHLNLNF